jgi:hypothetical protein
MLLWLATDKIDKKQRRIHGILIMVFEGGAFSMGKRLNIAICRGHVRVSRLKILTAHIWTPFGVIPMHFCVTWDV